MPPARRALSDHQVKMLFLLPTLVLLVGMTIFPLVWSLYLSFHRYSALGDQPPVYVGRDNYRYLLSDENLWGYFTLTAQFVALAVGLQFMVGFGVALLLNRQFRAKGLITTLLLMPMMFSPVVVGLFWKLILDANFGIVNYLLNLVVEVGRIPWLSSQRTALFALVVIDTWMWSPFMMLISLAGLSAVPRYLYEAADVDRASGWFKFRHVTLPMIAPLLLMALLFRTIDAFKFFDIVFIATAGGPGDATELVSMNLYRRAFQVWDTGQSCALAYIMLVIVIALSNLYIRVLRRVREG